MGEYLPYSGTNSIQEAVVALHFRDIVTSEAVRRAQSTAQTELRSVLPHFKEVRQVQEIKVGPGSFSAEPEPVRLVGFECSKVRADAKPARVLRFLDDILAVNFLQYQNWQTTLTDSLKYIETVLSSVPLETNPVQQFSLRYIDRYTFDGSPDEPHAALLFRKDNAYMAPHCFDSGPSWHCHSGWFESYDAAKRILNQLKVGSAMVDGVSTVTVDHNAIWQMRVPRQTIESLFQPSPGENTSLKDALNLLHDRNKTILRDMLLPNMLEKIGIET